ncbi:hypothetical protein [Hymenobacter latericus]|uniref:hypothetical protein n=1 Tax=Hymenobacter sp. YIM 151858-1 TaxID=2987688 RepID=UPI002225F791|nr:hypothetical protein [Hymenobacter sp. YIM 151858-1]UYZ60146.1 hypothetical protein OIS50_04925 [Hymenobacter sp. YIM 151858-1]
MKPLQEHIDEVMDYFDFHKAQGVMEHLNWKWASFSPPQVPDTAQLRAAARRYLRDAAKRAMKAGGTSSTGSGGLYAYAYANKETGELHGIELHFSLSYWSTIE